MQTFLPYPNFSKSAKCLDFQRLGKQRVEAMQLIRALQGKTSYARNHPACRMWDGYINTLAWYGMCICNEWLLRGYQDTLFVQFAQIKGNLNIDDPSNYPNWLGEMVFHRSHQSNLLRKDPIYYGKFNWNVPNDLPYYWPIQGVISK